MAQQKNSAPTWPEVEALPRFQELDLDKKISVLDQWIKESRDRGLQEGWWDKSPTDKGDDFAAQKRREIVGRLAQFDPKELEQAASIIAAQEEGLKVGSGSLAQKPFDKYNPQPYGEASPGDVAAAAVERNVARATMVAPGSAGGSMAGVAAMMAVSPQNREIAEQEYESENAGQRRTMDAYASLVNSKTDPDVRRAFVDAADRLSKLDRKQAEAVVVNGRVLVHPDNQLNPQLYSEAVGAAEGATDAQKRQALQDFPILREQQGTALAEILRKNDAEFRQFEQTVGGTDADKVEAYREKIGTLGALAKQSYSGLIDFGRTAVQPFLGAYAGLSAAAEESGPVSEGTQSALEAAQQMGQASAEAREYRSALGGSVPVLGDPGELLSVAGSIAPTLAVGLLTRSGGAVARGPVASRVASSLITNRGASPAAAARIARRGFDSFVSDIGFESSVLTAAVQSYGGTFIDAYEGYLSENMERGAGVLSEDEMMQDALNRAQLPAMASGFVTAMAVRGFGKSGVEGIFRAAKDKGFRKFAKDVFVQAGMEASEEGVDQFFQGLVSKATFRPEATLSDLVGESLHAAFYGGILGGGVTAIDSTIRGVASKILSRRADQAEQSGSPRTASVLRDKADQAGDQTVQEQAERAKEAAKAALDALGDQDTSSASGVSDPATTSQSTPAPDSSTAPAPTDPTADSGSGAAFNVGDSFNYDGSRGGEAGPRVITDVTTTADGRTVLSFGDRDASGALVFVDPRYSEVPTKAESEPAPDSATTTTPTPAPATSPVPAQDGPAAPTETAPTNTVADVPAQEGQGPTPSATPIITNIDQLVEAGGGTVAVEENGQAVPFDDFTLMIDEEANSAIVGMVRRNINAPRGSGMRAYIALGEQLAERGITLESSPSQYGQGNQLWVNLTNAGYAVREGNRYRFVPQGVSETTTTPEGETAPAPDVAPTSSGTTVEPTPVTETKVSEEPVAPAGTEGKVSEEPEPEPGPKNEDPTEDLPPPAPEQSPLVQRVEELLAAGSLVRQPDGRVEVPDALVDELSGDQIREFTSLANEYNNTEASKSGSADTKFEEAVEGLDPAKQERIAQRTAQFIEAESNREGNRVVGEDGKPVRLTFGQALNSLLAQAQALPRVRRLIDSNPQLTNDDLQEVATRWFLDIAGSKWFDPEKASFTTTFVGRFADRLSNYVTRDRAFIDRKRNQSLQDDLGDGKTRESKLAAEDTPAGPKTPQATAARSTAEARQVMLNTRRDARRLLNQSLESRPPEYKEAVRTLLQNDPQLGALVEKEKGFAVKYRKEPKPEVAEKAAQLLAENNEELRDIVADAAAKASLLNRGETMPMTRELAASIAKNLVEGGINNGGTIDAAAITNGVTKDVVRRVKSWLLGNADVKPDEDFPVTPRATAGLSDQNLERVIDENFDLLEQGWGDRFLQVGSQVERMPLEPEYNAENAKDLVDIKAGNKVRIVFADEVNDAKERILRLGAPTPEAISQDNYRDLFTIGLDLFSKGATDLAKFTQQLVAEIGEWVRALAQRLFGDIQQFAAATPDAVADWDKTIKEASSFFATTSSVRGENWARPLRALGVPRIFTDRLATIEDPKTASKAYTAIITILNNPRSFVVHRGDIANMGLTDEQAVQAAEDFRNNSYLFQAAKQLGVEVKLWYVAPGTGSPRTSLTYEAWYGNEETDFVRESMVINFNVTQILNRTASSGVVENDAVVRRMVGRAITEELLHAAHINNELEAFASEKTDLLFGEFVQLRMDRLMDDMTYVAGQLSKSRPEAVDRLKQTLADSANLYFGRQFTKKETVLRDLPKADPNTRMVAIAEFVRQLSQLKNDGVLTEELLAFNYGDPASRQGSTSPDLISKFQQAILNVFEWFRDTFQRMQTALESLERGEFGDSLKAIVDNTVGAYRQATELATTLERQAGVTDRGVNVEVAPNPTDAEAVAKWNKLDADQKRKATKDIGDKVLPELLKQMELRGTIQYEEGGFAGDINPSIYVAFGPETSFEEIRQFGIAAGAVMRQQAVIVFDEGTTTGGDLASHFRITPNKALSLDELNQFYSAVLADFPDASGFASRNGSLVFGNFSEVDDATFKARLKTAAAKAAKAQGFKLSLTEARFQSLYLDDLNEKLKQTEYGQRTAATQQQPAAGGRQRRVAGGQKGASGRNVLRGPGSPVDVFALFEQSVEQTTARLQTEDDGGVRRKARKGSGRTVLGIADQERGVSPARKGTFQLFKDKWVNLTHWSWRDNLKQTDPKKHGTFGAGQESARKRDYRKDWVDRTYTAYGTYTREQMIGGERYSLRVDGNRIYDFNKDPEDLFPTKEDLRKRGYAPFDDGAANTIYEKRIRDAGYAGYVNARLKVVALFEKAPATKVQPSNKTVRFAAAVPTTQQEADEKLLKKLAKKIKPSRLRIFKQQRQFLTESERAAFRSNTVEAFVDIIRKLPSVEDFAAAALGGQAKRGWYENSARALIEVFGLVDAPRFAALLAALSPQTSVENNLLNTLNVWKNWDAAGRPTDKQTILEIMGNSVFGTKGQDSVLDAWVNNSIRALTSPNPEELVISGPKVNSFMLNLRGVVNEVTNDAWMANFALVDQKIFSGSINKPGTNPGKRPGYLAMSARVRAAADYLSDLTGETWTPAEVQETVWSWAKTLYELQDRMGEQRTAEEILRDGDLTDEAIASTPDFATLLNNGTYRQILTEAGYGAALEGLAQRTAEPAASTQRRFTPEAGSAVEETIRAGQERSASRLTRLYEQRRAEKDKKRKTKARLAAASPEGPAPQQASKLTSEDAEAHLVSELKRQLGDNANVVVTDGGASPAEVRWDSDSNFTVYVSREQLARMVKGRSRLSATAALTKVADEEADHIAAIKALGLERIAAIGQRLSPEERESVAKRYIQRGNFDSDAAYEDAVKLMAGTAAGMTEAEINEALTTIGAEHLRQVGQRARSGETTEDTYRHFNDPSFISSVLNYLSKLVNQLQERLKLRFDPDLQRDIEHINAVRRELAGLPAVAEQAQAELESSGVLRNQAKRLLNFSESQPTQTFTDRDRKTSRSLLRALIAQNDDLARTLLSRSYVPDFYEEDNYVAESYIRSLIEEGLEVEEIAARLKGEALPEGMTMTQWILAKTQFNRRIYAAIQTIEDNAMRTGNVEQRAVARYLRDIRKDSLHDLQEIGTKFGQGLRVFREVNDQLDPFGALEALNGGLRRVHKDVIGSDAAMRALFVRLQTALESGASDALKDVSELISKLVVNTAQGTVKQKRLLLDVVKSLYDIYGDKTRARGRKADTAIPVMDRYVQDLSAKISNLLLDDAKVPTSGPVLQLVANQIKGVVQSAIKQEFKKAAEEELKKTMTEEELEKELEKAKDAQTQRILERLSQAILTRPWAEKALNETRRQIMRDIEKRKAEGKSVALTDDQIKLLDGLRLGNVLADDGLSGVVRRALSFREEIRKHVTSRETSQEMLVNFILDKFPVAPNVAESVAEAIRLAYRKEVQRAMKETAEEAIKDANTPPKVRKAAKSAMQDILELANMGAFSDEAFYNALATTYKLPKYDKVFSATVEREADRIQRMPENSDARSEASKRLLAQISKKHIDTLKSQDRRAWMKLYALDIPIAVWQAGVLSGVPTQLINVSMSNLNVLMRSLSTAAGYAMADKGASFADRAAYFADAVIGYLGTLGVLGNKNKSPNAIATAWRKGVATGSTRFRNEKADEFGVLEKANIPALTFHKYVGRIMVAADAGNASIASEIKSRMALRYAVSTGQLDANKELFEELLNPSESSVQSAREQAKREAEAGLFDPSEIDLAGFKGEARKARVAELRKIGVANRIIELVEQRRFDLLPDLKRQARGTAESWTFNEQAKGLLGQIFVGAIGQMNRTVGVTKFVFSFMNTLANLLNSALDFSPVGVARAFNVSPSAILRSNSPYRWDIDEKGEKRPIEAGSPEFYEKVLFGVAGSLTYVAIALLTYLGFRDEEEGEEPFFAVYGGGPTDKSQRQQLEAAGWQGNTFKLGGLKIRYQDLPAVNLVLSVIGAISDVYRYERGSDKTWSDKASTAAFGAVNVVTSKNLFQGASNLFKFMSGDPNQTKYGAASLLSGAVGGFTNPALLRWIRSTFDVGEDGMVKQLDYSTTEGWFYSMVPLSLGYDKAAVDYRGNEIKNYPWAATARRFGVIDPRPLNETDKLLVNAGLRITGPSKNTEIVLPTKDGQGVRQIPVGRHTDVWRAFQTYRGEFIDQTFTPALAKELVAAAEQDRDAVQTAISYRIGPKANNYAKAKVQQDIAEGKLRVPAE